MQYKQQERQEFMGGKAFEIVNNSEPSHAFLQVSNEFADQKSVITHVEAHSDFFANNCWFRMFSDAPDAARMLSRHAETIEEYMTDPDIGRNTVEEFIDHVLTVEMQIDQWSEFRAVQTHAEKAYDGDRDAMSREERVEELDLADEITDQVFAEWIDQDESDTGVERLPEPEYDLLGLLYTFGEQYDDDAEQAVAFEEWQKDVLAMMRTESYYFAPQQMTKVMNEGWACVAPDTRIFTSDGLIEMQSVVEDNTPVSDGDAERAVYDSNVVPDHDTVTIETRRGFELTGSNNHRLRRPDGEWIRLDELDVGDEIEISGGNGVWPTDEVEIAWESPTYKSLNDIAEEAGVSVWTVLRYRDLGRAERADSIEDALADYDPDSQGVSNRNMIRIPGTISAEFGRFLGLLVGDGHVPSNSGHVGFTAKDRDRAEEFAGLVSELFGIDPTVREQGSRWRVYVYSEHLRDLLIELFELPTGRSADEKTVPDPVLESPEHVVAEFIQGLFDADGYAGDQGVILSTKSEPLSSLIQQLLLNFGILSRRRQQMDGCYHVHLTGRSAQRFGERIGFGYRSKSDSLRTYLDNLAWFEEESWTDEVTSIEEGTGDVYDISVEDTHRYAGAGFVNHNSYWESTMMSDELFAGTDEFVQYADKQARVLQSQGLNPYALGNSLWQYVENRANRREVVTKLLQTEGITWRNFHDAVDFEHVLDALAPPDAIAGVDADSLDAVAELDDEYVDQAGLAAARAGEVDATADPWKLLTYEAMVERHYSLIKPANRGFLADVSRKRVEELSRYVLDTDRFDSIDDALDAVDMEAGWERMREVRESKNDATFIDEYLTQEFVDNHGLFAYEYSHRSGQFHVSSTDMADVRNKLLLEFTNFGKPRVGVREINYQNQGELLLAHEYNGIRLDIDQMADLLERLFELWGRPVNCKTIDKRLTDDAIDRARHRNEEPEPEEVGVMLRYDGDRFTVRELDDEAVADIAADEIDYDTRPSEWSLS